MFSSLTNNLTQRVAMLTRLVLVVIAGLLLMVAPLALANTEAITLRASSQSVSVGSEVEFIVSVAAGAGSVSGIETFVSYDPNTFERIGSGLTCDSSEFREILLGTWFVESCVPNDPLEGARYMAIAKSVALAEAGYGILGSTTDLYAFKLRVKGDAVLGESLFTLSGSHPRISRVFYDGVQANQIGQTLSVTIVGEAQASTGSGRSSGSSSTSDTDEPVSTETLAEEQQVEGQVQGTSTINQEAIQGESSTLSAQDNQAQMQEALAAAYDSPQEAVSRGTTDSEVLAAAFEEFIQSGEDSVLQRRDILSTKPVKNTAPWVYILVLLGGIGILGGGFINYKRRKKGT